MGTLTNFGLLREKNLGLKINTRKDRWYLETGSGMGPSLNIAVNKNAITLTDRAVSYTHLTLPTKA